MKKTKFFIVILAMLVMMFIANKEVKAADNDTNFNEWGYQLVNVGSNNYKLIFPYCNLKSGHDYYVRVEPKDNINDAFHGQQVIQGGLSAEFVNSVLTTKIREDGITVDEIRDEDGNPILSLSELQNNYVFFIFEEYDNEGTSKVTRSNAFQFKSMYNTQNNWRDMSGLKYDITRVLNRLNWDDDLYSFIMSNVNLNPDATYYLWLDKKDGNFFDKQENFMITAKLVNDIRLYPMSNGGYFLFDKFEPNEFGMPSNIEDLFKNYKFQIIEQVKVDSFEVARVVFDASSFMNSTSQQYWTNTDNLKYELSGNQDEGYSLKFSNLDINKDHKYYAWICKGEDSDFIQEGINLDFSISDYAYLYEINTENMTTTEKIRDDNGNVLTNPDDIYGKYKFQLIEQYVPYRGQREISKVIVNQKVIEEIKEEVKEEPKEESKEIQNNEENKDINDYTFKVLDGANQTYANKELTVRFDAPADKLLEVYINNDKLDSKYYTVKSGSTIITVKDEYLKTLKDGTYTLIAKYDDGKTAETSFKVEKADDGTMATEKIPQTGIYTATIIVSLIALGTVTYTIYKKYNNIVIK